MDGHDREDLVDAPRIEQRLEDAEVHEVEVGEPVRQLLQRLGELVSQAFECRAPHGPEELFARRPRAQVHVPEVEEIGGLGERVLGVRVNLRELFVARLEPLPRVVNVEQGLGRIVRVECSLDQRGVRLDPEDAAADHLADEHTRVRHECAARLCHDPGVRDACLVAHRLHPVDDVCRVLIQRVVDGRLARGARPVVVHAESAAEVEQLHRRARSSKLDVEMGKFADDVLHGSDVENLRTHVAVEHPEAAEESLLIEVLDRVQDLTDGEAELASDPGRTGPPPDAMPKWVDRPPPAT